MGDEQLEKRNFFFSASDQQLTPLPKTSFFMICFLKCHLPNGLYVLPQYNNSNTVSKLSLRLKISLFHTVGSLEVRSPRPISQVHPCRPSPSCPLRTASSVSFLPYHKINNDRSNKQSTNRKQSTSGSTFGEGWLRWAGPRECKAGSENMKRRERRQGGS